MNKKRIILLLITFIILVLISIIYLNNTDKVTIFKLYGKDNITIYEDEVYKEPGFICLDSNNKILTNEVNINSNLEYKPGDYTIIYSIKKGIKTYQITRNIKVLENPFKDITFTLLGSKNYNIELNQEYIDPLYSISNDNFKNNIKIESDLNNSIIGTYTIKYILTINGANKILERKVNVLEKIKEINLSETNPTNKDVVIKFKSNIKNFDYVIDPLSNKIQSNEIEYTATMNGDYQFTVYDDEQGSYEYIVKIENIDKVKPELYTCNGIIKNNKTEIKIDSKDNDLDKFVINDTEILNVNNNIELSQEAVRTYTYNLEKGLETKKVKVYDKAGNTNEKECEFMYAPIEKGNKKTVVEINTDTLKTWVERVNRSGRTDYYISHVWVKDAYKQLDVGVPNNFPNEVLEGPKILSQNLSKYGLSESAAIAVNGSGFCVSGAYGGSYISADSRYNHTAGQPLTIVQGKVLRNLTSSNYPSSSYVTYGLTKNYKFEYYTWKQGKNVKENIDQANKIINDGVRGTVSFSPVLVYNGQKKSNDTSKNIRNGICQIDRNNYLLFTDIYVSARNGFCFSELADTMLSLGCKYGFNLDGGGSTKLFYKNHGSSSPVTKIENSGRNVADIVYFHE